jgi:hypothetical protein
MSMGVNALADALIELGACDGLNKENCAKATMKMVSLGKQGRPFAAKIMGDEFETFKEQWKTAFKRWEAGYSEVMDTKEENTEEETGSLWGDADTDVE